MLALIVAVIVQVGKKMKSIKILPITLLY